MRIAFYAPLKPPDHPIPSGDRRVAQLFLAALRAAGHDPFLASRFRSYDGRGDPALQARLASLGGQLAERFLRRCRDGSEIAPQLWFTYHLYHKAPDWLGPVIADALNIPYVVAEASNAPKQAGRAWAAGYNAAESAIRRADAVIGLNPADRDCILPLLESAWRWIPMKPFVDTGCYTRQVDRGETMTRLIVIAMMRYGDKLASYQILGEALSHLLTLPWSLEVIGDGPAKREVYAALDPIKDRIAWREAVDAAAIAERLAAADLFVWPAVNEAFGMALLEAQASGVPVVAGDRCGVSQIVAPGVTGLLVPPGDVPAFAAAVRSLIVDRGRRTAFARAAQERIRRKHDLASAASRLNAVLDMLRSPDGGERPMSR